MCVCDIKKKKKKKERKKEVNYTHILGNVTITIVNHLILMVNLKFYFNVYIMTFLKIVMLSILNHVKIHSTIMMFRFLRDM